LAVGIEEVEAVEGVEAVEVEVEETSRLEVILKKRDIKNYYFQKNKSLLNGFNLVVWMSFEVG